MTLLFQRYINQIFTILFSFFLIFVIFRIDIDSSLRVAILSLSSIATYFSFSDLFSARLAFSRIVQGNHTKKNLNFYINNLLVGNVTIFIISFVLFYLLVGANDFLIISSLLVVYCVLGCTASLRLVLNNFEVKKDYEKNEIITRLLFFPSLLILYCQKYEAFMIFTALILMLFIYQLVSTLKKIENFSFKFSLKPIAEDFSHRIYLLMWQSLELFIHYFSFVILVNVFIDNVNIKENLLLWFRIIIGLGAIIRIPIDIDISSLTTSFVNYQKNEIYRSKSILLALLISIMISAIFYFFDSLIMSFIANSEIVYLPKQEIYFLILIIYGPLHMLGSVVINSGLYTKQITYFCTIIAILILSTFFLVSLEPSNIILIYFCTLTALLLSNYYLFMKQTNYET